MSPGEERPRIEAVIFDLGGVLIDWDPRYLFRRLFDQREAEMERFLTEVCGPEWNAEMDAGKPFAQGVRERQALWPDHAELVEAYDLRWEEMLAGAFDDTVAVLEALKKAAVPVYALTNFSAEKFLVAEKRFPFLGWFDGIVVSGREGLAKPDPRIYALALTRFGLRAERTLFIDDRRENAAAASAAGLVGLHFTSASDLRAALGALGLLQQPVESSL